MSIGEEYAKLIWTQGPLSQQELRKMPMEEAQDYFRMMTTYMEKHGVEKFLERKDALRRQYFK